MGRMVRCLAGAGAVVGLWGVGAAPAAANPPVIVVSCPPSPSDGLTPVCQGRAVVVRCTPDRGHGLDIECRGRLEVFAPVGEDPALPEVVIHSSGDSTAADAYATLNRTFGLHPTVEVRTGPRGVSFWMDTDKKPPGPRPR